MRDSRQGSREGLNRYVDSAIPDAPRSNSTDTSDNIRLTLNDAFPQYRQRELEAIYRFERSTRSDRDAERLEYELRSIDNADGVDA